MLEIFVLTGVDFPGITLACWVVGLALGKGDAEALAVGLALGEGDADGEALGDGDAVGVPPPPPPPPPLAGVVDAGVTPSIVIDEDSLERDPEPIALVARTCAEYCPADNPEKT